MRIEPMHRYADYPYSYEVFVLAKSRITAALLAFFLGGFGLHKFYLGKVFQGILYVLFSWTFIPTIIAWIEGASYLLMSDYRFARKFG
jgi:TM2 domain-containing membrane protein YozV